MALLMPSAYEHVFGPYQGKKVCLARAPGNWGDILIAATTHQLFAHFGIHAVGVDDAEIIMYCGGGNMGPLWPSCVAFRSKLLQEARNRPIVILPQSWTGSDGFPAVKFFTRETVSLRFCPQATLAPDLALAYELPENFLIHATKITKGIFFRTDREKVTVPPDNIGDPAIMAKNLDDYLLLASRYRHIHTNRLHFAVAGLLVGSRVTIYANSYHKNKAVFELWLRGRACEWGEL